VTGASAWPPWSGPRRPRRRGDAGVAPSWGCGSRPAPCTLHHLNRWFAPGADAPSTHIMLVGSPFAPRPV